MKLRIVSFEDSLKDQDRLQSVFANHEAQFFFFQDPQTDWDVTEERAKQISAFEPDFIIVDLRDDKLDEKMAGLRTIRQLKERKETQEIPVIAWSVLFKDTPDGWVFIERAREMGAIPLLKTHDTLPNVDRFLTAAKLNK